jgi:hypothetical protein
VNCFDSLSLVVEASQVALLALISVSVVISFF